MIFENINVHQNNCFTHVENNDNNIINYKVFNYFEKDRKAIFRIKVNELRQCNSYWLKYLAKKDKKTVTLHVKTFLEDMIK